MKREFENIAPAEDLALMNTLACMETPLEVAAVRELLEEGRYGTPANTITNCRTVLSRDALLKGAFCFNELTERVDIVRDLGWKRSGSCLDDVDMQYILEYFENNYQIHSENRVSAAIKIEANEHRCHPIRERLSALVWDGTKRIRTCLPRFFGVEEDDAEEEIFTHFLLGAIRRVFEPGCKFDEVFCLVGGQGVGKSTFFRFLAIEDDWFSDDLKRLDDDKIYQKLQGHWIIEMSEMLALVNARSVEELRSFLSRQKDTYRTPYEAQPKDRLRQCVFTGTSNSVDFLPLDRAGNRRFLPLQTHPENAAVHILDEEAESRAYLLQVWAEAMVIYRSGRYSLRFSKEMQAELRASQREFMTEDTDAGMIQEFLEKYTKEIVCTKLLYREALKRFDEPGRGAKRAIKDIMDAQPGWKAFANPRSFGPEYGKQRGWERVEAPDDAKGGTETGTVAGTKDGLIPLSRDEAVQIGIPDAWMEE